jgi:hypothetical protein
VILAVIVDDEARPALAGDQQPEPLEADADSQTALC